MGKRWFIRTVMVAGVIGFVGLTGQTQAASESPAGQDRQKAFVQQAKQNLAALNFQEVTVAVLGGQYQKEINNLQQMQAVFCDTYKLDVTKFRQGRYRFDEKEAKFVEQEPATSSR